MICTETYVRKADDGEGGAGYEAMIVTAELIRDLGANKFIPIIRQSSGGTAVPMCLAGRMYVNLSDTPDYEAQFQELLKRLHNVRTAEKSPLGTNPFAAKTFEEEKAHARREERRVEFSTVLSGAESAFRFALETARSGDKPAWRRLLKASREQGVAKLIKAAEQLQQTGFFRGQVTEEDVQKVALEHVGCYAEFTACLLAGVASENPVFAKQLSWMDAILAQPEWPKQGFTFLVEMPELIFFALQALVGGN